MTVVHGNEGVVKSASDVIAKVESFTLNVEAPISDNTGMGDAWEESQAKAPKRWSVSLTCKRVADDTAQGTLTEGATVALGLYGDGEASGASYYSGSAIVERVTRNQSVTDNVSVNLELRGTGALATDTVA